MRTIGDEVAGEGLCSSAPHEDCQLAPHLIVKHKGLVLCLGGAVGEPQSTPTPWNDAQLLHLHSQKIFNSLSSVETLILVSISGQREGGGTYNPQRAVRHDSLPL